ncbi:uncharacterized protein LOC119744482 [Patiria miniata]|uniref:Uncharacterized protein n=1 Tax=Patiria miniata TaxID=46514 RepID=A0A914BKN2_PATMI|nr:uncharacterized protein LOC119744482 [Patiria miniata]
MARTLLLSLAVFLGFQVVAGIVSEWIAKDEMDKVCMKIKFDGMINVRDNPEYNTDFGSAVVIDPKPNCMEDERTITIGVGNSSLQLTFRKQSQSFVFTNITAKWLKPGSGLENVTGSLSDKNFLSGAVPLGCFYSQDEPLSIPFQGGFSAELKNVTFQPFADCAKNDYGNDYSSRDCPTDCSRAARPGSDIIYVLLVAVVGAISVKFMN